MGCIPITNNDIEFQQEKRNMKWLESPVGKFILELDDLFLEKLQDRVERKEQLMIVFKLASQEHRISLKELLEEKGSKKIVFAINSCYKKFGRYLSIQVWNLQAGRAIDIGFGVVDLHQELKKDFHEGEDFEKKVKVYLNYRSEPAGFLSLQTKFYTYDYENLQFKVFTAMVRSTLGKTFSNSRCVTRITIGEEVLQTKEINSQTNYLDWRGHYLSFRIPQYLKQGKISVIEKVGSSDIILGELSIDLKALLLGKVKTLNEEIQIDELVTGKIIIHNLRGENREFAYDQPDSPRKMGRNKQRIADRASTRKQSDELQLSTSIQSPLQAKDRTRHNSLPPIDVKQALQRLNFKRKKIKESN